MNPTPNVNIVSSSTSICSGQTTTLTASGGGTYSWNTTETTAVITVSPTIATSYSVTVSNGLCSKTASVNVTVNPPVTANVAASSSTICSGQNATLTASGGSNYSWSSGQITSSIIISPTTSTNYTVIVSNGSCSSTANASITVNPTPTANIASASTSICAGQTTTLTASGGGTYLWNTGAITNVISVSPAITTSYTVTVTNASGCTATAISAVTVTPLPIATVTATSTAVCAGDTTTLTAGGGGTYSWIPGGQTSPVIVVNPPVNTTYSVIVSIGNCKATASTTVIVHPLPIANSGLSATINYGGTATLTASGGGNYSWNTGELTQTISVSPITTTVYCVTVTDASGCSDSSCVTVKVDINCGDLFIPNAFSPNGDGKNDFFLPRDICLKTIHLIIYDRWGSNIFETEDLKTKGWDGMYKGEIGETAVFSYYFKYELVNGESGTKKGTITLMR